MTKTKKLPQFLAKQLDKNFFSALDAFVEARCKQHGFPSFKAYKKDLSKKGGV